jgi:hypothetical protein
MIRPAPPYWSAIVEFDFLAEKMQWLLKQKGERERQRQEFDLSADTELPALLRRQAD